MPGINGLELQQKLIERMNKKNGVSDGTWIRLTVFSINRDILGIPFNFKSFIHFFTIFNNQNKLNKFNQNQNILHQIYTKVKISIQKFVPAIGK